MKARILVLLTSVILSAAMIHNASAGHGQRFIGKMTEQLNLSEEQASQIQAIFAEKKASRENKRLARQEVEALIESGDTEAAAELAANHARQRVLDRAEFVSQIKAVLSEEQFAQWQEVKAKHEHRRYKKH